LIVSKKRNSYGYTKCIRKLQSF